LFFFLEELALLKIPDDPLKWIEHLRSIQHLIPNLECRKCGAYPYENNCPFNDMFEIDKLKTEPTETMHPLENVTLLDLSLSYPEEQDVEFWRDLVDSDELSDGECISDDDSYTLEIDSYVIEIEPPHKLDEYHANPDKDDDGSCDTKDLEMINRPRPSKPWLSNIGRRYFGDYAHPWYTVILHAKHPPARVMKDRYMLRLRIWRKVTELKDSKLCPKLLSIKHLFISAVHNFLLVNYVDLFNEIVDRPNFRIRSVNLKGRPFKIFVAKLILEFITTQYNYLFVDKICELAQEVSIDYILRYLTSWEKKYMNHNARQWILNLIDSDLYLIPECLHEL
jgi:hypothetical protein